SREDFGEQNDPARWAQQKERLAEVMRSRTRDEWCELLEGTDACFAPVLTLAEAPKHPAAVVRGSYIEVEGVVQPAPAPRYSRTAASVKHGPHACGADTRSVLAAMGFAEHEIDALRDEGAIQ
ncbi:MAG: CoA transferase, partial [Halieaceae bacterium]|nr:CoA transferase [Halieaceae bacterium]